MYLDITVSTLVSALEQLFGEASFALMAELEKQGINTQSNDKLPLRQLEDALEGIIGYDASFLFVHYLQNKARKAAEK